MNLNMKEIKMSRLFIVVLIATISRTAIINTMQTPEKDTVRRGAVLRDISNNQFASAGAVQCCTPERPTQVSHGVSTMGFTPAGTRTQTIEVFTDARVLHNIMLDESVAHYLNSVAACDQREELLLASWVDKRPEVRQIFSLHPRVSKMLAPVMRSRIAASRQQFLDQPDSLAYQTPDKGSLSHTFTIEHMINIVKWGTAYLCVDYHTGSVRLNIIARVTVTYSDRVRSRQSLTPDGWATLSFILHEQSGPECIHYFVHDQHPERITFLDKESGFRGYPYLMLPITVHVNINPYSKQLVIFFQDPNEYQLIRNRLFQRMHEQQEQQRIAASYVTPVRQPVTIADYIAGAPRKK